MPDDEDFYISYKSNKVKVSPVLNGGNIYFIVHLQTPLIIAEGFVDEDWAWLENGQEKTALSTELGELIEKADS